MKKEIKKKSIGKHIVIFAILIVVLLTIIILAIISSTKQEQPTKDVPLEELNVSNSSSTINGQTFSQDASGLCLKLFWIFPSMSCSTSTVIVMVVIGLAILIFGRRSHFF